MVAFTFAIEISFHIGLLLAKVFVWYNFGTGASEPIRRHLRSKQMHCPGAVAGEDNIARP